VGGGRGIRLRLKVKNCKKRFGGSGDVPFYLLPRSPIGSKGRHQKPKVDSTSPFGYWSTTLPCQFEEGFLGPETQRKQAYNDPDDKLGGKMQETATEIALEEEK